MTQVVRAAIGAGLLVGMGGVPLLAQSLALPAADPVGIARSGAQVAYGYSLEAAAANPALLSSLKEKGGFYLSGGLEMMAVQQSLESEQTTTQKFYQSTDRNRFLAGFGLAARVSPRLTLGLKLDQPYMRHGELPAGAPTRYLGESIDLNTHRLEGQASWAFSPNVSAGIGIGVARLSYDASTLMRFNLINAVTDQVDGLVEQRVGENGHKVVPSYSLGFRWAISPRWTLGVTHQSGLKGDLSMTGGFVQGPLGYYAPDGLSVADTGLETPAAALLAASRVNPGRPTLELPSQTTIGMRHRVSTIVTWEADLRWTSGNLQMPSFATVSTPNGLVVAPAELPKGKGYLGIHASTEIALGKFWTIRGGLALDQQSMAETGREPLLGGSRTSAFSFGAGYRVWGGEVNLGYQFRQSEDQDSHQGDGTWSANGFSPRTVTRLRLEGMGHILALGFKKTF
jgi:long-subunit fatty acid transport protein